jgi:hypothetical protein
MPGTDPDDRLKEPEEYEPDVSVLMTLNLTWQS